MRKLIALGIACLFFISADAQKVNRRYTFQGQADFTDGPSDFVELSDGTLMLVWTSFRYPSLDTCYIRARKILKSGASSPIVTLDKFPFKYGLISLHAASIGKEKFGLIYQVPDLNSKKCAVVFSTFSKDGKAVLMRKPIGNSYRSGSYELGISADADGKYALGWMEFRDSAQFRYTIETFDAKDNPIAPAFVFDSSYAMGSALQHFDYKNGKIAVAMLYQDDHDMPRISIRTFSEKGLALSKRTVINEEDMFGLGTREIQVKILSNTEFAVSWIQSFFKNAENGEKSDSAQVYTSFFNFSGEMIGNKKILPLHGKIISSLNISHQKGKIQFACLEENGARYGNTNENAKRILTCEMSKTEKNIPDTVYVLETANKKTVRSSVFCRPTSKYRFFVFNSEANQYTGQQTLSYAYFLWKEKKPKVKKEKAPKEKKVKEEKKKEDKPKNGNGRG